jgi:hypothetical protein
MWCVDVFRLSCTGEKLFEIFGCALKFGCKFAFETNFCNLTRAMTPSLTFYDCTLCVLPRAHIEPSSAKIRLFCAEIRAKRFKLEIPTDIPKMRGFGDNSSRDEIIDETPKGASLAETASIDV